MQSARAAFIAIVLLFGIGTAISHAQSQPTSDLRRATLADWHHDVSTALRDRWHAYGGLFFDRGIFRRLTPAMDHEYDMDLLTYGFTADEDAAWYASDHAVRTYMGSIHKSRFATRTRFRNRVTLAGRHEVLFDAMQQEDLSAQRFFIDFRYGYQLNERHRFGFSQTIAAFKPDLDLTLYHAYESPAVGALRVEVGLLDFANNLIFDGLGVDPALEDTIRSYRRKPYLLAAAWASPVYRGVRIEAFAGIQTESRAVVRRQSDPDFGINWTQSARYVGLQLEYAHSTMTGGAQLKHTYSDANRRSLAEGDGYRSAQESSAATVYALAPIGPVDVSLWATFERYADRQSGTSFAASTIDSPLDYLERRFTLHTRLAYVPERGIRAGADYFLDHRRFLRDADRMNKYLMFLPWSPNGRFAVHVGYQFSRQSYFLIGAAYDAGGDPFYDDGRGPVRYDGGFGRIVVMW